LFPSFCWNRVGALSSMKRAFIIPAAVSRRSTAAMVIKNTLTKKPCRDEWKPRYRPPNPHLHFYSLF
jgi:hypothetical protein